MIKRVVTSSSFIQFFMGFLTITALISISFFLFKGYRPVITYQDSSFQLAQLSQSLTTGKNSNHKVATVPAVSAGQSAPMLSANYPLEVIFEHPGKVLKVYVKVGDLVSVGQPLVNLDTTELLPQLHKDQAAVDTQQIKIDKLKAGVKTEDILNAESNLTNAMTERDNDIDDLANLINNTYINAEDAVRNKVDQFFVIPTRSSAPQLVFSLNDSTFQADLSQRRLNMEALLISWKNSLDTIPQPYADPAGMLAQARQNLNLVRDFVEKASLAVNQAGVDSTMTAYNLHLWKADTFSARTNINTAIKNLIAEDKKIKDVMAKVKLNQSILDARKAVLGPQELQNQDATLRTLKSQVDALQAYIAKMSILATVNGKVTKVLVKPGSVVVANQVGFSITTN